MSECFQILSLDGGGIKGLFSAAVLALLEEDLDIRVSDHFDMIVGTSTGGIIALCLGIGMSPREIVQFYVDKGPKIFPPNTPAVRRLLRSKYDPIHLEKALKECFHEKRLADSRKRLVIPSYSISEDHVYLFKTPHHERLRRDYKVPLWKVAMATCAAPTYLPAYKGIDGVRLIDGGVWANNPTMVGIVEAVSMLSMGLEGIRVLSLGTTADIKKYPDNLDRGGIAQWCRTVSEVILRGQSIAAYTQAVHLLGKERILRIDPVVPEGLFRLDKLSETELYAKAAYHSRVYAPGFQKHFMDHKAEGYTPYHN